MEIVALLLAWAFALTFVALTGKPKRKTPKAATLRVPANLPRAGLTRNLVVRHMNRQR
jgi:hypothetical protein